MRHFGIALALSLVAASAASLAAATDTCVHTGVTTCTPRWEDKKTKKPKYSQKCEPACVRGHDGWCDHGCCPEQTSPCGIVITKKKLLKRDEDKVERVLKYDVGKAPCIACPPPAACGPSWYDLPGHCRRLFGLP